MASPSGNHQHAWSSSMDAMSGGNVSNGKSSRVIPGSVLGLKDNHDISLDWTKEEQALLEQGLVRFASESLPRRYAKIANQLKDKTVRDVALRVRWMNKKEIGKRRKDDQSLTRERKDKKERVSDPPAKSSHFAPPSSCGISYKAILGPASDLLDQNEQALSQISTNLAALHIKENINLFCQTRDNIVKIMNDSEYPPEKVKLMPPIPVKMKCLCLFSNETRD